jgi:N-acetylneuraminic acid mutarotase
VVTVNGDAYLIGGFIDTMTNISNYTYLKHIHKFDRAAQKFIPVAPIPWDVVRGRYISFSLNNKLYVGLGEGGNWMGMNLYNDLWEFNPATNSWLQKNNFPGRLRSDAATFIINGIMYMIGGRYLSHDGFITDEESDELWKYDPLADQWTQVLYDKSKGPEPFFAATTISHDGFGYILGGFTRVLTPSGYIIVETQNYRYDPGTNSFEKICNNVSGTVIHSEGNKFILVYKGVYGDQSYYSKNMYELILE